MNEEERRRGKCAYRKECCFSIFFCGCKLLKSFHISFRGTKVVNLLDLLLLLLWINSNEYEKEAKNSSYTLVIYRTDSRAVCANLPFYETPVRRFTVCVCRADRVYCLLAEVHCRKESAKETVRNPATFSTHPYRN